MDLNSTISGIIKNEEIGYPTADENFSPSESYPEYPFPKKVANSKNTVYEGVRKLMINLKIMTNQNFNLTII